MNETLESLVWTLNVLIWTGLSSLAIDNVTSILTSVDLLERPRLWFASKLPRLANLASCAFCQSWWLCFPTGISVVYFPDARVVQAFIVAMVIHRVSQFLYEFFDRYLNRAPMNLFATVVKPGSGDEVKPGLEDGGPESGGDGDVGSP